MPLFPSYSGQVIQVQQTPYNATSTGTTLINRSNTTPVNTDGDQIMTITMTPKLANSTLLVEGIAFLSTNAASIDLTAAIFRDTATNAAGAYSQYSNVGTEGHTIPFYVPFTSGSTASTTFKVRAGGSGAGTTSFNTAVSLTNQFGAITKSYIKVTEVAP